MNPATHPLHAREFLLSVLQITRRTPAQVGFLVAVGETLGLPSSGIRVALTRLLKSGLILSPARGQYALAPRADPVGRYLNAWRMGEARVVKWSGHWRGCLLQETSPGRKERGRSIGALERMGYISVQSKFWVRPDCVALELAQSDALAALGLESGSLCFILQLDQDWSKRWNTDLLNWEYAELAQSLPLETQQLGELPREQALAQSFHRGKECIETLGFDPLLPAAWVDHESRGQAVAGLLAYDARARELWAETLTQAGWSKALLQDGDGQ